MCVRKNCIKREKIQENSETYIYGDISLIVNVSINHVHSRWKKNGTHIKYFHSLAKKGRGNFVSDMRVGRKVKPVIFLLQ